MSVSNNFGVEKRFWQKRWFRVTLFFVVLLFIIGGVLSWKTGSVLNKITGGNANIFKSIVKSLPGVDKKLQGEDEGRINILLLGMRGENVPGGGLLADTIMVLSIHPKKDDTDQSKASLISIPRDLYVKMPGRDEQRKINAAFALGEERERGKGGMTDMRSVVGEVTGLDIPYAATINFQGFTDLVNALGGITVNLSEPFNESQQFHEPQVCDPNVYTIPTKPLQYQYKYYTRSEGTRYVTAAYPLCYNHNEECGGNFSLPKGESLLDGTKALCYARARYTSNDFERAKRQQEVIKQIKAKALSVGTLTDFSKINAMLDSLGNNASTNLEAWEMKRLFELYQKAGDTNPNQRVLQDSEEGLLYAPPITENAGYILLPRGDNYDRVRDLFKNSLNY